MLYPFKLSPTYRDYVWGGKRLRPDADVTAESWVVYEGNKIADGPYAGQTLAAVARQEGAGLLGSRPLAQTGNRFPLLIKLLDCAQWLSLQVHPNDEQAERLEGPGHFGKTEAWYVVDADDGAQLLSGFRPGITHKDIRRCVGNQKILDLVEYRDVRTGDTLFMPPGTIHALGPGLMVYEVQQTSDLTYRVYDWDRPMTGRRKLHIKQAIEVLDPSAAGEVESRNQDTPLEPRDRLITSQYFALELWACRTKPVAVDLQGESFSAITALEGRLHVCGQGWSQYLDRFDTLLVPASCNRYQADLGESGTALHAFLP